MLFYDRYHRLMTRCIVLMKEPFLKLFAVSTFLPSIALIAPHIIVYIGGFSFFKIVDEYCTKLIPNYGRHNFPTDYCEFDSGFSSFALHSGDCWWYIHVSFIIQITPFFILLKPKQLQTSSRCFFQLLVNAVLTSQSCCISKYSCKIWSSRWTDFFT